MWMMMFITSVYTWVGITVTEFSHIFPLWIQLCTFCILVVFFFSGTSRAITYFSVTFMTSLFSCRCQPETWFWYITLKCRLSFQKSRFSTPVEACLQLSHRMLINMRSCFHQLDFVSHYLDERDGDSVFYSRQHKTILPSSLSLSLS